MNGAVDQESGFIEHLDPSVIQDLALVVDTEHIAIVN
jgi:hypothetical protein